MATGGNFGTSSIYKAGHEEYFELTCTPCADDGRNSEAVKFCEDCGNYLCTKCLKDHKKFPALRNHKLLDAAAMTGGNARAAKFVTTEPCPSHRGSLIDTHCGDHDVVCCPTCVSLEHRACTDINYLPLVAKGIKNSKEYKTIIDDMVKVKSQLERLAKSKKDDQKRLDKEMGVCLSQIKDFRMKINKQLDDLEKKSLDKVQTRHQEYQDNIKTDINKLEGMISTLEASIDRLKKVNIDNEPQVFVSVKMGKSYKTGGNKLAQEMQARQRRENLNFQINTSIEDYKSLGDFSQETQKDTRHTAVLQKTQDHTRHTAVLQKTQDHTPYTAVLQKSQDDTPYTASLLGKYDVKVGNERECNIYGSCLLDDSTLLITDHNNDKLKRLNSSYKVIDHIQTSCYPWGVCAAGTGEAAVTLCTQKKIQFVSLGNKMTLTRTLSVGECCRGVAYSDGELFVSCGGGVREGPGQVRTYNTAGQLLRTVQADAAGQNIFSCPRHIAVSTDGKLIHVANDNGVISLDRRGNKQSQLSDPDLKGAYGICRGENDQMFVCGYDSSNILQLSRSGRKLGVLLDSSDGIKNSRSVCYNPVCTRLIVTMHKSSHIAVYNLTKK